MKATIFNIQQLSFVDGPGIRTTVFFKGCNLNCSWCHNPESQAFKPQMMLYREKCTGCGKCKEKCRYRCENCDLCGKCTIYCPANAKEVCGKDYTVDDIFRKIEKGRVYYENTDGGVTFSGGECMLQIDFLREILKKCKEHGIHTAVDTAGYVLFDHFEQILPFTDLFLYDVKVFDTQKHKEYTGVGNELILENLKKLFAAKANIWIRIPVIPGVNDSVEEMRRIKTYLQECGTPQKIELLPYHALGEHKYRAFGENVRTFSIPTDESMALLRAVFD